MSETPQLGIAEDSCLKNRNAVPATYSNSTTSFPSDISNHNNGNDAVNQQEKGAWPPTVTNNPHNSYDEQSNGTSTDNDESPETFPEGGLEAWLVVLGSWCAMVQIFGLINTSGIFESYFKTHQLQDYSHSQIGWIFSLYLFVVFFVGIQVGPIFDRHGPRFLVAAGSLLVVTSLMLLSLSTKFYQIILTYSVMGGLGGALLNTPAYGAIAHFFNERRGFATGIASTAGGIGGLVFPLLLRHLLGPDGVGFAWSCRILGFMMLALSVPANIFIKSRLTSKSVKGAEEKPASIWPDLRIFRNVRFTLASAGYFFMEWGLFVPLTYVISYGTANGLSTSDSSLMLSLLNAGSVVGRLLPGLLSDKLGRFNVIIVTITLCVITVLGIWLPCDGSRPVLIAFCVLFGVASGSNLSLVPVCLGQFCESQHYGRYYTSATMLASFGTLSSVPVAGALLDIGEDAGWIALISFSGASYFVALVCYTAARVMTVGWRPQTKF